MYLYNMQIVNGATEEDRKGQYTFANAKGHSTIDICAIGGDWVEMVKNFKVGEQIWSDHMPIEVKVEIEGARQETEEKKQHDKLMWRGRNIIDFQEKVKRALGRRPQISPQDAEERLKEITRIFKEAETNLAPKIGHSNTKRNGIMGTVSKKGRSR